jgi:hypothetical protein
MVKMCVCVCGGILARLCVRACVRACMYVCVCGVCKRLTVSVSRRSLQWRAALVGIGLSNSAWAQVVPHGLFFIMFDLIFSNLQSQWPAVCLFHRIGRNFSNLQSQRPCST